MEYTQSTILDLRAPLIFAKNGGFEGEFLSCFDIDPAQSLSIEPEREKLTGNTIFTSEEREVTLPKGKYLFTQSRQAMNREEWLGMAVEQQKDGLWMRCKLENRLYVRILFEDGSPVTQLFRPIKT